MFDISSNSTVTLPSSISEITGRPLTISMLDTAVDQAASRLVDVLGMAGHSLHVHHDIGRFTELVTPDHMDMLLVTMDTTDDALRHVLKKIGPPRAERPHLMVIGHRASTERLVSALDEGADDYLLLDDGEHAAAARIRACSRRMQHHSPQESPLTLGRFQICPTARAVMINTPEGTDTVHLPAREFLLVQHLFENPGKVIHRDALMQLIWGEVDQRHVPTLSTYISKIRNELALRPRGGVVIATLYGIGYRLELQAGPRRSPIQPPRGGISTVASRFVSWERR